MTVKTILMKTVLCNVCDRDICTGTEYVAWTELWMPLESARDGGWLVRRDGELAICESDLFARACRIFGHEVKQTKDGPRCSRCLDSVDLPEDES